MSTISSVICSFNNSLVLLLALLFTPFLSKEEMRMPDPGGGEPCRGCLSSSFWKNWSVSCFKDVIYVSSHPVILWYLFKTLLSFTPETKTVFL